MSSLPCPPMSLFLMLEYDFPFSPYSILKFRKKRNCARLLSFSLKFCVLGNDLRRVCCECEENTRKSSKLSLSFHLL